MAAVTADRVIVELEAKIDRYEANVRRAEQKFDSATKSISDDAKRMEREVSRNADAVGARFRTLAGTIAAAFSVREVAAYADSYTRFTNTLAVAGLEGEKLADIQERLLQIGAKNGVELETLGSLYGRVSQSANELGASSAEILQLTEGVAAGLRVQGASAQAASGAILGLVQALGSSSVKAEEFNQINEGAPALLRAVAENIDAAGGSVSKLRTLVVEGEISNQEFFRAFLAGSAALQEQADKSSLTIANSFTVLNNAIGAYIGQADESLSATERVSSAVIALSENLDLVAGGLGVIATLMLGRFAAGMTAGAASTGLASTAIFAMQARAAGAATTMEALALTSTAAGRALLAAFGGPVGLAVTALTLGVYYLASRTDEAAQASGQYAAEQDRLRQVQEKTRDATDTLAVATGRARDQAIANATALRDETNEYLANARAALEAARAKAAQAAADARVVRYSPANAMGGSAMAVGGNFAGQRTDRDERQARTNQRVAEQTVAGYEAEIARLNRIISAPAPRPAFTPTAAPTSKPSGAGSTPTRTGPTAEEIAARFLDDLERGRIEIAGTLADAEGTIEARRAAERQRIEAERQATARAIKADADYSDAQKERLLAVNDEVAAARLARIAAEEATQAQQEAAYLRQEDLRNQQDILAAQASLAETAAERRDIELRILDLQLEEERAREEAIIASREATEAERQAARRRLATIDATAPSQRERVLRDTEGPFEGYRRRLNRTPQQISEDAEQWAVEELEGLQDGLHNAISKAIGTDDPVINGLIDLLIEQVVMKPLADALSGAASGSGGGGILGGILSGVASIFTGGRASGGHVSGGQLYQVNEQGVEGFQPAGSGKIIPLGRMRGAGGGGAPNVTTISIPVSVTAPGANEQTVVLIRRTLAEVTPEIVKAAEQATARNLNRRRLT